MQGFRKLQVWQKAYNLTLAVYHATKGFPKDEAYGLTSQLRRACASIPTNTAEGCGRGGNPELAQLLRVGMGSACEVEYQLLLAHDLVYLDFAPYQQLANDLAEVKRMLSGLLGKVAQ